MRSDGPAWKKIAKRLAWLEGRNFFTSLKERKNEFDIVESTELGQRK